MNVRTPLELLFEAALGGFPTRLMLHSLTPPAELVLRNRHVTRVQGVPGLLDSIAGRLPEDFEQTGELREDVLRAVDAGLAINVVLDAASLGVARFLAGLADRKDVFALLVPAGVAEDELTLPLPALRLVAWGLADQRDPEGIFERLRPRWEQTITTAGINPSQLPDLDPVALRTLKSARGAHTLGELLVHSGRLQLARTRRAWLALDLLLQFGLIRILGDDPQESSAPTPKQAPPDESSPTPIPSLKADELEASLEEPRPVASAEELLDMADLCAALSPLALLRLDAQGLAQVFTLRSLHQELWLEYGRYHPRHFADTDDELRGAAEELERLMRSNRSALRDPTFMALRLRQLRTFADPAEPAPRPARRQAAGLFMDAQEHIRARAWDSALTAIVEARALDPLTPRFLLLEVFCRVALRKLTPANGLLNIDSQWLQDPAEQALAHHLAGRILRAWGKPVKAEARLLRSRTLPPVPSRVEDDDDEYEDPSVEIEVTDDDESEIISDHGERVFARGEDDEEVDDAWSAFVMEDADDEASVIIEEAVLVGEE